MTRSIQGLVRQLVVALFKRSLVQIKSMPMGVVFRWRSLSIVRIAEFPQWVGRVSSTLRRADFHPRVFGCRLTPMLDDSSSYDSGR